MELVRRLLAEPPLTAQEERRLALLSRGGDLEARDALVRGSLRLVALRAMALRFGPGQIDDAFQAGAVALVAAVRRFDPDRGARLATYAWPWITRAMHVERRVRAEVPHEVVSDPVVPDLVREASIGPSIDLSALPGAEREALLARFSVSTDGACPVPWEQVARDVGTSVATARRRCDRAVSRLREEVGRVSDRAPR